MLTEELKAHTKGAHLCVEKMIVQKIRSVNSTADYVALLEVFYGFFSALENLIEKYIQAKKLPDYNERRKADALLTDIAVLQSGSDRSPIAEDLPNIESHSEALGALYVIEGSTLGGKIIARMLREKLPAQKNGFSFFDGYGNDTDAKWETFKTVLNNNSNSEHDIKLTLSAALETFEKFKQWIERYDSNEKL